MKKTIVALVVLMIAGLASGQDFETLIGLPDSSAPFAGAWSPTQNTVYMTNAGTNKVVVIDGATNGIITYINVGLRPEQAVWHSTNDRVFVGNVGDSSVSVIDCASNAVVATIPVGNYPGALVSDPERDQVYTANRYGPSVSVIDAATNSVVATVPVGTYPLALALASQLDRLFVACQGAGEVWVMDLTNNTVGLPASVGQYPWSLAYEPVGRKVYVACYGSNTVEVMDAVVGRVTKVITGVGTEPHSIAAGGAYIYSANNSSPDVAVIDPVRDSLIRKIRLSSGAKPKAMVFDGAMRKMYCALNGGNQVAVFVDGALLKTVGAKRGPEGLVLNSTNRRVYVAGYPTDTIAVIRDTPPGSVEELPVGRALRGEFVARPQPARDQVAFEVGTPLSGTARLVDRQGRVVFESGVKTGADGLLRLSVRGLVPGVYLLELRSGGDTRRGRLLVAR